ADARTAPTPCSSGGSCSGWGSCGSAGPQRKGSGRCSGGQPTDALIADIGGTSTDIGVLVNGFPWESSQGVEIGGIRTNLRMPDLVTIAIGGGTVLGGTDRAVRLGPVSVGFRPPWLGRAAKTQTTRARQAPSRAGRRS